jgi:DNA-binding CsgD family transcriptional regulator
MTWADLDPRFQHAAERVLNDRELEALKMSEDGMGYWQIATHLDLHRSTVRDRIRSARRKVERAMREEAA